MSSTSNIVKSRHFLLLMPPLPVNSPVVHTVLASIHTVIPMGYRIVPQFLSDGPVDLKKLAADSKIFGDILPLVDLPPTDVEKLRSYGATVHKGAFSSSSPLYTLAAGIFGAAGREMACRMVSTGHRNLVYVCSASPLLDTLNQLRYAGAMQGCIMKGIPAPIQLKTNYHSQTLSGELVKLFAKNPQIDGFMCHEDILAMETIQALKLCGRMVPSDCAVIGVDNTPESALFTPPITSVSLDTNQIGRLYGNALVHWFNGQEIPPLARETLEKLTTLVVRDSG